MRYEYVTRKEQRIRKLVPAIHNLVFIYSTRKKIDEIKEENAVLLPLRYIMDRETKQPIIVPEIQMRHFIAIAGSYDQQVITCRLRNIPCRKEIVSASPVGFSRVSKVYLFV